MASINQDFTMYEGNSKRINVTLTEADGSPVNLIGSTIRWVLKKNVYDATTLIIKDTNLGIVADADLTTGKFTIKLVPADTNGHVGTLYHEAELEDSLGNITTILTGNITIQKAGI